jgi:hypothetical protein
VAERAVARKAGRQLVGMFLRVGDQLLERACRRLGSRDDDDRRLADEDDRREIALRVERHLLVHERVGGGRACRREKDCVAVGLSLGHRGRADVAAGPAAVLDHHRPSDRFRKMFAERAADDVRGRARRERHHHRHRPGGPSLGWRLGASCDTRQAGEGGCEKATHEFVLSGCAAGGC